MRRNELSIEGEIALNDIALSNPQIRVKWRIEEREFTPEDIAAIVDHYEASDILHNLLNSETLEPLIDNHSLLSLMHVEDEALLTEFVEDAFFSEADSYEIFTNGLDILYSLVKKEDTMNGFIDDDFDEVDNEELLIPVVSIYKILLVILI